VREQFNGDVTTLLSHSDLSSDLTVVGGLYQQRLDATYFGAGNYLPANVDAGGHTLTNALYQALTTSSWFRLPSEPQRLSYLGTYISDGFADSDGSSILIAFSEYF